MKNICIITQCSLPVPTVKGGAVETLVEYLINQNETERKFMFTVITLRDEAAVLTEKKYKYTKFIHVDEKNTAVIDQLWRQAYRILKHMRIYMPFSRTFLSALKVLRELEEQDLYLFEAGPTSQIPIIKKIVGRDKLFVHLHWDGMGTSYYRRCCKGVIAISDYILSCWAKSTGSKDNIAVLKNCVDIKKFDCLVSDEEKDNIRSNLSLRYDDKVILYVGRIIEAKGIRELLQAFENINDPNAVLMIIGSSNFGKKTDTPFEREVQKLINNSHKKIIFTGYINQKELYKYYSVATCSVMPSQFQEPAGLVAIEAQSTGTPLIATDVGGLSEYCSAESSILVKKDENQVYNLTMAIEMLLNDNARCQRMGECGKKFASKFNVESYYDTFADIINDYC